MSAPSKKKNPALPPLVRYLRSFCETLPRLNKIGQLARKSVGSTGSYASKELNDPTNALTDNQVKSMLGEKFPNFPIVNLPSPSQLATKILRQNQQNMTEDVVLEAASYFRIPKDSKCLAIMPEYFFRSELAKHKRFQVLQRNVLTQKEEVVGVRPCCPWCKTNQGIQFNVWEVSNVATMPRAGIDTDASLLPLLGARYWCKKKGCVGKLPEGEVHSYGSRDFCCCCSD